MKRMSTEQKISSNRLTKKRTKKYLKRREHIRVLKIAGRKINMYRKQIENLRYRRMKYANRPTQPQGPLL
jgi:hypothetical protein